MKLSVLVGIFASIVIMGVLVRSIEGFASSYSIETWKTSHGKFMFQRVSSYVYRIVNRKNEVLSFVDGKYHNPATLINAGTINPKPSDILKQKQDLYTKYSKRQISSSDYNAQLNALNRLPDLTKIHPSMYVENTYFIMKLDSKGQLMTNQPMYAKLKTWNPKTGDFEYRTYNKFLPSEGGVKLPLRPMNDETKHGNLMTLQELVK